MDAPYLHVEIDKEVDDRWIAEVLEVPGAMAYGRDQDEAVRKACAIALRVLAELAERGEATHADAALNRLFKISRAA